MDAEQIAAMLMGAVNAPESIIYNVAKGIASVHDAAIADAQRAALERAATAIDARRDAYVNECGSYDSTTGVTEFPGNGDEYVYELEEIAEAVRALIDQPTEPAGGA